MFTVNFYDNDMASDYIRSLISSGLRLVETARELKRGTFMTDGNSIYVVM